MSDVDELHKRFALVFVVLGKLGKKESQHRIAIRML
jgi:hypothetical protein